MRTDLWQALRSLTRAPLFTTVVVVLLALGIGANTLIFTAVDVLIFRPLAVVHPEQLARLGVQRSPDHVSYDHPYIYARVLREHAKSFSDVFVSWPSEMAFGAEGRSETITGETVSGNYFQALGLRASLGRLLLNDDEKFEASVAVLSQSFRQRVFGTRDPIGSTIRLHGSPFTVVGVLGPGFSGLDLDKRTDVWLTMSAFRLWALKPENSKVPSQIFLRRREGVSLPRAEAEVRTIFPAMVEAFYAGLPGVTQTAIEREKLLKPILADAGRGVSTMRKTFTGAVGVLMGAVTAMLLLVCANVSGLLVARGLARSREMAIRLSLGATRANIMRRMLLEALLLAVAGAAAGWVVAAWFGPLLLRFLPQRRPLGIQLTPDFRVLAFAALACVLTALLLSAVPAWQVLRANPNPDLARGGLRVSSPRTGRMLVALQVALGAVLITGGISLVRTLHALRAQDPGFRRDNLIVMTVNPRMAGVKSNQIPQVFDEVVRRAKEVPGVEFVSLADRALMRGIGMKATVGRTGSRLTFADSLNASINVVSPGYFSNMRMRIVEGRGFRPGDDAAKPRPSIVSQSFALRFFPGGSAIGRTFGSGGLGSVAPGSNEIVGVIADAKYRSMREPPPPTYYELLDPQEVKFSDGLVLYVGTRGNPARVIGRLREMLAGVANELAPTDVATMENEIETSLWQERLLSALASIFAGVSALLAGLGLFGMLAYAVTRRTREIGIRVAVGATPQRILALFFQEAARSVLPGLLLGLAVYWISSRNIASLLYGVSPWDPSCIAMAAAGVIVISAAATLFPATQASLIQPSQALREE